MMLHDKIALVTGAEFGIGLATVNKFLQEGATVVGVGSHAPELQAPNFTFLTCDVRKSEEIESVCHYMAEHFKKLDCLVTVCDRYYAGSVAQIETDTFDQASRHILRAPILFTKYCNDLLHQSQSACILHNVPVSALMMEEDFLMSSLNTAVVNYVRQSAPQIRPVRVNAVMYGLIKGHLLSEQKEAKYTAATAASLLPAKRLGTPEDVANFNAFLASDRASYLNSAAMQVDGGLYAMNPRSMGSAI